MATVFIGTSQFAAAVLERLAGGDHRPALVITRPDRPAGRGRRLRPPPVGELARELGLELAQPENVNGPESLELVARALERPGGGRPAVVVCAFGALIKEPLLSAHEILNVHPSLLPRWRGAAPVERAMMAGDERTGVSIMRLTAGLDSGPVCATAAEDISSEDDYGTLAGRLEALGAELLIEVLDTDPPCLEQPLQGITYADKITPADRLLDPTRPAVELALTVRALHPHIGARVRLEDGELLRVRRARVAGDPDGGHPPGGVFARDGRLMLGCSPGLLELLEVQPPGARAMDAGAYLRGHPAPGRR